MIDSDFVSMKKRISNSTTLEALTRVDDSMKRLWYIGIFSAKQFQKLDELWCDKRNELQKGLDNGSH